jgi:hypothetical protein
MKNAILYAIAIMQLIALTLNYAACADTVANLLQAYEKLSNALFQDDLVAAQRTASKLANEAKTAKNETVAIHAADLAISDSLFGARQQFKKISAAIIEIARQKRGYHIFTCAMPQTPCLMKDCDWVQSISTIENPYLGQFMPGCGMVKE